MALFRSWVTGDINKIEKYAFETEWQGSPGENKLWKVVAIFSSTRWHSEERREIFIDARHTEERQGDGDETFIHTNIIEIDFLLLWNMHLSISADTCIVSWFSFVFVKTNMKDKLRKDWGLFIDTATGCRLKTFTTVETFNDIQIVFLGGGKCFILFTLWSTKVFCHCTLLIGTLPPCTLKYSSIQNSSVQVTIHCMGYKLRRKQMICEHSNESTTDSSTQWLTWVMCTLYSY